MLPVNIPGPLILTARLHRPESMFIVHMDGQSEFTLSGNLKDYDATGKLGNIKVPTLFMGGQI